MFGRTIYSFSFSVLISSLHIGCCVLPLFSVAIGSSSGFQILNQYKPLITTFQVMLLMYILVSLLSHYTGIRVYHSRRSLLMGKLSLAVVVAGLLIGYTEPFKTENQRLAEQQFKMFQTHRQLTLLISGEFDQAALKGELSKVNGIKSKRIAFNRDSVQLTYSSELTSRQQIMAHLRKKGYEVTDEIR